MTHKLPMLCMILSKQMGWKTKEMWGCYIFHQYTHETALTTYMKYCSGLFGDSLACGIILANYYSIIGGLRNCTPTSFMKYLILYPFTLYPKKDMVE